MTAFVETDFLLALAKDDDWLQEPAEAVLERRNVVTSPLAYLELLIVLERHEFDFVRLFANLLDIVPVRSQEEKQVVLKAVTYFDDGMTPFDSFHAATAETQRVPILSSDKAYEDIDADRIPLEADTENESDDD
jgi:predicted nucleic acid-binding protein